MDRHRRARAPFLQTNSSGSVSWQADYEPFGAIYAERTADVHQPLRLPGQEAEAFSITEGPNGASGRYYNAFRWYRPAYGRYTQTDPIGYFGSTYNLYAYAQNNPFAYIDPLGLDCSPNPISPFLPIVGGILIGLGLFGLFALGGGGLVAFGLFDALVGGGIDALGGLFGELLADEAGGAFLAEEDGSLFSDDIAEGAGIRGNSLNGFFHPI